MRRVARVPYLMWIGVVVASLVGLMAARILLSRSEAPAEAARAIVADGKARRLEGLRYLEYRVGIEIHAPAEAVWALLTDAPKFPSWNSTIISIDGDIAVGQRIRLKAKVAPERTFPLLVSERTETRMVWQDGNRIFRGVRTFTLTCQSGVTTVTMAEVLTGAFLPQIAPKLPDFGPGFEAFVADLKRAAESA